MWKRLFGKREDEPTAARQDKDVHALDRPGDRAAALRRPTRPVEEQRERDRLDETG
jgi:hypothetical protein